MSETTDWHNELRERCSTPNMEPRQEGGHVYTRSLGKRCPHCPNEFFTYQAEGKEREPYRVDPNPPNGQGVRETCGHPECHEREDHYQFTRRVGFQADAAASRAARQAKDQATPKPVVML